MGIRNYSRIMESIIAGSMRKEAMGDDGVSLVGCQGDKLLAVLGVCTQRSCFYHRVKSLWVI